MILFVTALLSFGVLMIFVGLGRMVSTPTRADIVLGQYARPKSMEEAELAQPFVERVVRPILRRIAQLVTRFTPQNIIETTRHKLDLAGNPFDLPVLEFLGIRGLCTILGTLLAGVFFTFLHANGASIFFLSLSGAVLGFYAPALWLNHKIGQRQEDILVELPDALDLLTICVEAGLGLDAAIAQLVGKWDNHLSRAFGRLIHEIRLGKPREAALRDTADRAGVRELTNFIAAVIQAERFGAGIARVLRIQSDQQRVVRRQRAQNRANQLPIKLLFPLTFFIFPSIFIILLGPALIRLMQVFKPGM